MSLIVKLLRYGLFILPFLGNAQRLELAVSGGISNYQGDLQPLYFTWKGAKPAGAVALKYPLIGNLFIRAGFSLGALSAADSKNRPELRPRNLDFHTSINELHAGLEYRFFNPEKIAVTPYVFIGAGVFMFNPYTFTTSGQKTYLQPLATEGQGLAQYPDRKPYQLIQFSIPYGFGIKWQVNCNLNLGAGFRQAKTFTDYLDDVSVGYINETALRNAHGQTAVDLAWRRNTYDGTPYPSEDLAGRGNPKQGDWYYFADFTVGLNISDCETGKFVLGGIFKNTHSGNGIFKRGGSSWGNGGRRALRKSVGCPKF